MLWPDTLNEVLNRRAACMRTWSTADSYRPGSFGKKGVEDAAFSITRYFEFMHVPFYRLMRGRSCQMVLSVGNSRFFMVCVDRLCKSVFSIFGFKHFFL